MVTPPALFTFILISVSFFISGAAALIYQTLWVRSFSLTLGNTTLAVSAVLAAFMGGLAAGNFISGKISRRIPPSLLVSADARLIYLYVALQAAIAFSGGIIAPLLIKILPAFILGRFPDLIPGNSITSAVLRAVIWYSLTFFILLVPATLMGATLPILVKHGLGGALSRGGGGGGEKIRKNFSVSASGITSFLLGVNTLGSVSGVVLAGFFLIKNFGVGWSYRFAACLNLLAALLASAAVYWCKKDGTSQEKAQRDTSAGGVSSDDESCNNNNSSNNEERESIPPARGFRLEKYAAFILFLSGAAAMIAEVSWTRVFSMILGSSAYSFTIMLAVYLIGFSTGNFFWDIAAPLFIKDKDDISTVGKSAYIPFVLVALAIIGYMPLVNYLPYFFVRIFPYIISVNSVFFLRVTELMLASSVMLLPTFFMGLTFPWLLSAVVSSSGGSVDGGNIGYLVGKLQSANTVGGILGSVAAGLFLVRFIGTENSLVLAGVFYVISGALLFYLVSPHLDKKIKICAIAVSFAVFFFILKIRPLWDPYIMTSGMFTYANLYRDFRDYDFLVKSLRTNRLLYYKDGVSSSVAVFQTPWKERFIRINGKTDASSAGDMPTQILLAYVPSVIVRPQGIRSALVIGLGSGITAGALSTVMDKEKSYIDCVEIEPAVRDAAKFFVALNRQILEQPFFNLIFTDARHYLAATSVKKYDIIISEPSNPWISGIANLFTREAFQLGAGRLAADGVFCQWLQSYSISEDDFRLVMRTFASVFSKVALFATARNDYLMVGTNSPEGFSSDYLKIKEMFEMNPRVKRELEFIGIHQPFSLITTTFMLDDREFREYAFSKNGEQTVHTDDKTTIEFTTPLYLYRNENEKILAGVESVKKSFIPGWIKNFSESISPREKALLYNESAEAFLRQKKVMQAKQSLEEALKIDDKNPRLWVNMGRVENLLDNHIKAEKDFRRAIDLDVNYPLAWFHLGMLYYLQGLTDDAINCLEKGLRLSPGDPMGSFYLSEIYMNKKLYADAVRVINKALVNPVWDQELRNALVERLSVAAAHIDKGKP